MEIALLSAFLAASLAAWGYLVRRGERLEDRMDRIDGRLNDVEGSLAALSERVALVELRLVDVESRLDRLEAQAKDNHEAVMAAIAGIAASVAAQGERIARIEGAAEAIATA